MSDFTLRNKKQSKHQTQSIKSNSKIRKQGDQNDIWNFSLNSKNKPRSQQPQQIIIDDIKKPQDDSKSLLLYELTEKERQMIADLSKIFIAQNPHPKKILIKINQMKRCHLRNQDCKGCLNCRIDRIQINRLPDTIQTPRLIPQFKDVPQIRAVLFDLNISSQNDISVSQTNQMKFTKNGNNLQKNKILKIVRTIAITYKPEYSASDYSQIRSISQAPFTKFRRYKNQSPQSNVSINNQTILDELTSQKNVADNDFVFIKLVDLNFFVKKKHVQKQLLETANAANQKIMNEYQKLKENLNFQKGEFNRKLQDLTKQNQMLKRYLQSQKIQKDKLNEQITNLKKSLNQVREIKQIFLRENNTLKEKQKQNTKLIQELRREIMRYYNGQYMTEDNMRLNLVRINSSSTKIIQETSKRSQLNQKSYVPQLDKTPNFTLQSKDSSPKLVNIRSTHTISRGFDYKGDNRELTSNQGSVKSQRTIGIRKNSPKFDPNTIQQKNLVKVSNNYDGDHHNSSNILYASKNQRQNKSIKSISNYSEISSSLSQRVGYIQKPSTTQARKGILLDYMLDQVAEKNDYFAKQVRMTRQNMQASNRVNESPRERFQYKSIK